MVFPIVISRFLMSLVLGKTKFCMWNVEISNQFWNQWRCLGLFCKNIDKHHWYSWFQVENFFSARVGL